MKCPFLAVATLFLSVSVMAVPPGGKELYQRNCASCHGQEGQGGSGPKLVGDASEWKAKLFERAVLRGIDDHGKALKSPMPHWKDTSFQTDRVAPPTKAEVDAIQSYLRSLQQGPTQ